MSNRLVDLGKKLARYVGHFADAPVVGQRSGGPPCLPLAAVSSSKEALRPETWAASAWDLLRRTLEVQKAALLTFAACEQDGFCALQAKLLADGSSLLPAPTFWPLALRERFHETDTIALRREIERWAEFQATPSPAREWLRLLDMEALIALDDERGLSILALGPKSSGGSYTHSELEMARLLVNRAKRVTGGGRAQDAPSNQELAHLGDELRRLEEARSSFLTIASHELKTPLTLIQGYANMLGTLPAENLQGQEGVAYVTEGIIRGAGRLRQIIDDMLDVSRIDTQALNLQWRKCSLAHMIGLATSQIASAAEERGQTITIQPLEGLPAVEGDGQRLCQALRNILENAIKYTPDGGRISITAQASGGETEAPPFVEIVIADQGIGIAPQNQELIFERFARLGDADLHSSSRVQFKGGGPGLGLTITRGIIEAHGGKVWVESEGCDEKRCPGSQFHIRLLINRATQTS